MPISILETANSQLEKEKIRSLLERINASIHKALCVPDEGDQEIRWLTNSEFVSNSLKIAFTVGDNEYPDFEPSSFYPTVEQLKNLNQVIEEILQKLDFTAQIIIESWANSSFVFLENLPSENEMEAVDENIEIKELIGHLQINAFISPDLNKNNPDVVQALFLEQLKNKLAQFLKINQENIDCQLIFPDLADTDISIEIDCIKTGKNNLSISQRELILGLVMEFLQEKITEKNLTAEIWLRQGEPEIFKDN